MHDFLLPEKLVLTARLVVAQIITLLFLTLSLMSFSLPYMASIRPEFFMMLVYYWAVFRPTLIAPVFVFGLGLILDVFSGFPMGVNAFSLILVQWLVQRQRLFLMGQSFLGLWIGFMIAAFCTVIFKWSAISLFSLSILPFSPALASIVTSILFFPLMGLILLGVHKILPVND